MAKVAGRWRTLVKKATRDPKLPWSEGEDALAVAARLIPKLDNAALRIIVPPGPPDVELKGLCQLADAIQNKLAELVVLFTPGIWSRVKVTCGIAVAATSFAMSIGNVPAVILGAASLLFAGEEATRWGGMEAMRLRLKSCRLAVEAAAAIVRAVAFRRGL